MVQAKICPAQTARENTCRLALLVVHLVHVPRSRTFVSRARICWLARLCWLCFVHQWCQCLMDQLSTYCLPLLSPSTSATHPLYTVLTGSHKCLSDFQLSHPAAVTDAEFTGIDVLAYCLCSVRILLYHLAYTALAYTNTLLWQFFGLNKIRIEYLLQPYEVLYNESQFLSCDARQSAVLLWQSCLSVHPWRWGTLIT